jgi:hypothetical protein
MCGTDDDGTDEDAIYSSRVILTRHRNFDVLTSEYDVASSASLEFSFVYFLLSTDSPFHL